MAPMGVDSSGVVDVVVDGVDVVVVSSSLLMRCCRGTLEESVSELTLSLATAE